MLQVSDEEIKTRLRFDNPWWTEGQGIDPEVDSWPRRDYFDPFVGLVTDKDVRRAVVLMGPRRVGKTVMVQHTVKALLDRRVPPTSIFYVSVDNPTYTGLSLEKLVLLFQEIHSHDRRQVGPYVFFDEVQYLKDWEVHLKSLVDSYPGIRFIASGSAAAALRLKSRESGAGRFTDFLLPPLTFAEFLWFRGLDKEFVGSLLGTEPEMKGIEKLNEEFVAYVNYGGFPEPLFSESVRGDLRRFVGNDIIDKVLLRDLPALYGIQDSRELNQLFSVLAYNTGSEVSLDGLAKASGVAKNTLRKYLDYLEAAFLIHRLYRVDQNARRFKRVTSFKVYLTNPSLRAALFGSVGADDAAMGRMAENAYFAQVAHHRMVHNLYYARWKDGEVDFVRWSDFDEGRWLIQEIKWSDRPVRDRSLLKGVLSMAAKIEARDILVLTRTAKADDRVGDVKVLFVPVSIACYALGAGVELVLRLGMNPRTYIPYNQA